MGVVTFTEELTSPVPAKAMFAALILDFQNLIPKLIPNAKEETIQGTGGPGTIRKLTFTEGDQTKYVKHRVDELDKENMVFNYTIIEGEALLGKLESISYEIKYLPTPDGGCKVVTVTKYYPKPGAEFNEEEAKEGKQKAMALFKGVEAYLIANPGVYA